MAPRPVKCGDVTKPQRAGGKVQERERLANRLGRTALQSGHDAATVHGDVQDTYDGRTPMMVMAGYL